MRLTGKLCAPASALDPSRSLRLAAPTSVLSGPSGGSGESAARHVGMELRGGSEDATLKALAMEMPQKRGLARKEPVLNGLLGLPGHNAHPLVGLGPRREVGDVLYLEWLGTQLKAVLGTRRKGKVAQRVRVEDGDSGKSGLLAQRLVEGGPG